MSSGVTANSACINTYQDMKLKKNYKYITYRISDDLKEIIVDKTSSSTDYADFIADLPKEEPRWAVYDVEFEKDGGKRNKLTFISWSPDDAKIKAKMVYASSRDALRKSLDGVAVEIQATDVNEIAWESVLDKASRGR
ncbi:hypothetical protein OPQ81_011562 [Rhizoctonia solani]|nr:hypothetical protein OPQ81_011562 [Rhizoctonia solani]